MSQGRSASEQGQAVQRRFYAPGFGRDLVGFYRYFHGLGMLAVITCGVTVTKFNTARAVFHPLLRKQIANAGFRLLPMVAFLAMAMGMVIDGQLVLMLDRFGAQTYAGTVMVTVVFRELGPLIAAALVLGRAGTANVVELGTARAMGEVEALEALGIDPIHYLVVPRVIALAISVFALTVYFIIIALLSGYLFAFLENVPLQPAEYFRQLASALRWQDFVMLAAKTVLFGTGIGLVTCFEGLARPLRLEEVGPVTAGAVAKCVVGVVLIDALFVVVYAMT